MDQIIKILVILFFTWIISDLIKTIVDSIKHKQFRPRVLLSYGGMPSSHTMFVTSLATTICITEGLTTSFVIAGALVILVVRDLITIRGQIDDTTVMVFKLARLKKDLPLLSHKISEIVLGFILGIVLPIILNYFL